jgi:hypothetical protein
MSKHPTSKENIALNLIFYRLGESRFNRSSEEYAAIKFNLPRIKVLHGWVNDALKEIAADGAPPYDICYFKVGDRHHWYEPFPSKLSIEVVRSGLVKSGFRDKQIRKRRTQ